MTNETFNKTVDAVVFDVAMRAFLAALTEREVAHVTANYQHVKPGNFSLSPGGRRFVRVVKADENGSSHYVYCFVERATGNIYKPAGWKAPTLNIVRGNIFAIDQLRNTNPYGANYAWDLQ